MGIASVFNQTVLAIDNSTLSCAWALFSGKKLIDHGEILFIGNNTYERLVYMPKALKDLKDRCMTVNVIVIEKTTFVQSKQTAILLGMAAGAVISHIANPNTKIVEVAPTVWQNFIGNGILTAKEKRAIKEANPGKSANWLKEANRRFRKQRTMDFVESVYNVKLDNDNQSDSIALGHYYVEKK